MPEVFGFTTNSEAQPVEYVEGTGGDFGSAPVGATWRPIPGRSSVPVVAMDIPTVEKVRAGIEASTPAKTLYFALVNGEAPFSERDIVEVGGTRYDVRSVAAYDVGGLEEGGDCEIVKL